MTPSDEALTPEPSDDEDAEGEEEDGDMNGYINGAPLPVRLSSMSELIPRSRAQRRVSLMNLTEKAKTSNQRLPTKSLHTARMTVEKMKTMSWTMMKTMMTGTMISGRRRKSPRRPKHPKLQRSPKSGSNVSQRENQADNRIWALSYATGQF